MVKNINSLRDYRNIGWRINAIQDDLWTKSKWIASFNFLNFVFKRVFKIYIVFTLFASAGSRTKFSSSKALTITVKLREIKIIINIFLMCLLEQILTWEDLLFLFLKQTSSYFNVWLEQENFLLCVTYLSIFLHKSVCFIELVQHKRNFIPNSLISTFPSLFSELPFNSYKEKVDQNAIPEQCIKVYGCIKLIRNPTKMVKLCSLQNTFQKCLLITYSLLQLDFLQLQPLLILVSVIVALFLDAFQTQCHVKRKQKYQY